jgi:CRP-like cAMP-binding protein
MNQPRVSLLKNASVFASLSDRALEVIEADARIVTVAPGDFFFRQGEQGNLMYILKTGHCRIHISWSDREVQLGRVGPGDCFGEIALIDSAPRSASVQADTLCTAIGISKLNLSNLKRIDVAEYATVQENLARELCRRLRIADANRMLMTDVRPSSVDIELWP